MGVICRNRQPTFLARLFLFRFENDDPLSDDVLTLCPVRSAASHGNRRLFARCYTHWSGLIHSYYPCTLQCNSQSHPSIFPSPLHCTAAYLFNTLCFMTMTISQEQRRTHYLRGFTVQGPWKRTWDNSPLFCSATIPSEQINPQLQDGERHPLGLRHVNSCIEAPFQPQARDANLVSNLWNVLFGPEKDEFTMCAGRLVASDRTQEPVLCTFGCVR